MKARNLEDGFKIISDAFDELDYEPRIYVRITELRSLLWKKHRITRKQMQEMLERLCAIGSPYRFLINLCGGPSIAYKKDNWVEVGGKHQLLITVETEKHQQYMRGHRG